MGLSPSPRRFSDSRLIFHRGLSVCRLRGSRHPSRRFATMDQPTADRRSVGSAGHQAAENKNDERRVATHLEHRHVPERRSLDAARLKKHLGVAVDDAATASEALAKAERHRYRLILVNRELDRDHSSGLELVPNLIAASPQTPVMLVSDFEEAQAAAIEQGAARGFGKRDFDTPATLARLREIVGAGPGP